VNGLVVVEWLICWLIHRLMRRGEKDTPADKQPLVYTDHTHLSFSPACPPSARPSSPVGDKGELSGDEGGAVRALAGKGLPGVHLHQHQLGKWMHGCSWSWRVVA